MWKDGSRNHLYPRSHPGETQYFSLITKPPAFRRGRSWHRVNPSTIPPPSPRQRGLGQALPNSLTRARSARARNAPLARLAPRPSGAARPCSLLAARAVAALPSGRASPTARWCVLTLSRKRLRSQIIVSPRARARRPTEPNKTPP